MSIKVKIKQYETAQLLLLKYEILQLLFQPLYNQPALLRIKVPR